MLELPLSNLAGPGLPAAPALPLAADRPIDHVLDVPIWEVDGWFLLTNHMILMVVVAMLMLILFPLLTRRYRRGDLVPTGTRNFFEAILMFVRNDIAKPVLGDQTDRFIPFLWTLFFFILFNNLIGLLPLDVLTAKPAEAMGLDHPIYGTATANLGVTAVLAIFSFIVWNVSGIRANGIKAWASHFLGGAPWYMAPVMVPVEVLGMFVKPFALSIRLMANMTAGHVLVAVLIGMTATVYNLGTAGGVAINIPIVLGTTAIMVLELFVAFLQAYIFTFLTTLFIGQMIVHEHEHEHDDEHEQHAQEPAREKVGKGDLAEKLPPEHAAAH